MTFPCIISVFMRIRNIQIKDKSRIFSRFKTWKNSIDGFYEVEKNLFIYSPIIFPAPYNKIISYYIANFYNDKYSLIVNLKSNV